MEDAWERLGALSPTLTEAEFKALFELTRRRDENNQVRISSRQLAEATGISRSNIQRAIDTLSERGLISTDGGTATRAAGHKLAFLETAVLPGRGPIAGPPHHIEGGLVAGPQVALFEGHGGPFSGPGVASQQGHPENKERAPARGSGSDSDYERRIEQTTELLERIAKAQPENYDSDEIRSVREILMGYHRRLTDEPTAHPPHDKLCAELLVIAQRKKLFQLWELIWRDFQAGKLTKKPASYRWWVTVALQRIYGLEPAAIQKAFSALRIVEKHVPDPEQRKLLPEDEKERMVALHEAVRLAAAGKAFR